MARQRSFEKKPEPAPPAIRWFLPMELQIGDRLADETGTWEVIAPPYSTAGGRIVHRWHLPHVSPDARGQAPGGPAWSDLPPKNARANVTRRPRLS